MSAGRRLSLAAAGLPFTRWCPPHGHPLVSYFVTGRYLPGGAAGPSPWGRTVRCARAVHALCEKLAVLHHQEFGKFRRLKGRH